MSAIADAVKRSSQTQQQQVLTMVRISSPVVTQLWLPSMGNHNCVTTQEFAVKLTG